MYPAQQGYRTPDSESPRGFNLQEFCQGRRQSHQCDDAQAPSRCFAALIAVGSAPACGAAPGSVSGVVRDSAGVPQMGAVVQLLRPDLSVIASVYTDEQRPIHNSRRFFPAAMR